MQKLFFFEKKLVPILTSLMFLMKHQIKNHQYDNSVLSAKTYPQVINIKYKNLKKSKIL